MAWNKREVRALTAEVLDVLNRHDIYGLQPGADGGPPLDEYMPEAMSMVSVLVQKSAITPDDVRTIWIKWFGDDLSGLSPLVELMAAEMTELIARRQGG